MTGLLGRTGFRALDYRKHWQTLELGYVGMRAAPYLGPLAGLVRAPIHLLGLDHAPLAYWVGQTMVVSRKA
jgi:hypothetical protein